MNPRFWVGAAGVVGFLGVLIGAFGAHGLASRLEATGRGANFETAVRYHLDHVVALVAVALLAWKEPSWSTTLAGWCFLGGILLFSGSLYVLALTGARWWGAITPLGGVSFLVGWALLAWSSWKGISP